MVRSTFLANMTPIATAIITLAVPTPAYGPYRSILIGGSFGVGLGKGFLGPSSGPKIVPGSKLRPYLPSAPW